MTVLQNDRNVSNGKSSFRKDEMVVATPYASLVTNQLRLWGTSPDSLTFEDDPRLKLTKISLDSGYAVSNLRDAGQELLGGVVASGEEFVRQAEDQARSEGLDPTSLDVLLRCLRVNFSANNLRWVPTFGKNRLVQRLRGSYVIDGGGDRGLRRAGEYVIDGGGVGRRTSAKEVKVVQRRRDLPGQGVRAGVVDTRLFPHPWLAGAYLGGSRDLMLVDPYGQEPVDHATFVVGLILRQAPAATVEIRAGLDDHASEDTWHVARAIADLSSNSADVVNLSFGCTTEDGRPPLVLSAAIAALADRTVVVAAAGNHGDPQLPSEPVWPAALDDVIAVGAVDGDQPADFSPTMPWVDTYAPGVNVTSTCYPEGSNQLFARWSGTSFAAATVTGAIAAAVTDGCTPREAWNKLIEQHAGSVDSARVGRPVIPLPNMSEDGWPADHVRD